MNDLKFEVKGFWMADEVALLAGVAGLECTTGDGYVIVHPRPRALTEAEVKTLQAGLKGIAKPSQQERIEQVDAAAKVDREARSAAIAAFREKAAVGKTSMNDLTEAILLCLEGEVRDGK